MLSALLTAFGFGFRHGIDWDHLAALTDITGSQTSSRRSMGLATLYALGHAAVVFVLGIAAIGLSAQLPDGVNTVMEHVVGATLVLLGVYVLTGLIRRGRDFRMRSRWMLLIGAVRRLRPGRAEPVVIEHEHEHAEDEAHGHVHVHVHAQVPAGPARPAAHSHVHRHVAAMPDDPFMSYGRPTALFIGMLHGVGAETPTQVVLFLTVAGVSGRATGITLLVVFLGGLLLSNTVVALAATYGFLGATRHWPLYLAVSLVTAIASITVGTLFLTGAASSLPAIFGG